MSETSQGDGWWVASDGKWYPPEQAASDAPSPIESAPPTEPIPAVGGFTAASSTPFAAVGGGQPPYIPTGPQGTTPPPEKGGGSKTALVAIVCLLVGALLGGGVAYATTSGTDEAEPGAEWNEFCDQAAALEALPEGESVLSDEEGIATLQELIDAAPERYQDAFQPLVDLAASDGSEIPDTDAFGDVFLIAGLMGGVLEVECGLATEDVDLGMGSTDLSSDDVFGSDDLPSDDTTDTTDDSSDDTSTTDITEDPFADDLDDPMSIDSIQAALEERFPGASWLEQISSWLVSNGQDVTVAPFEPWLAETDPMEACEGVSAYVLELEPEAIITVNDDAETPLVELTPASGTCQAVG